MVLESHYREHCTVKPLLSFGPARLLAAVLTHQDTEPSHTRLPGGTIIVISSPERIQAVKPSNSKPTSPTTPQYVVGYAFDPADQVLALKGIRASAVSWAIVKTSGSCQCRALGVLGL